MVLCSVREHGATGRLIKLVPEASMAKCRLLRHTLPPAFCSCCFTMQLVALESCVNTNLRIHEAVLPDARHRSHLQCSCARSMCAACKSAVSAAPAAISIQDRISHVSKLRR